MLLLEIVVQIFRDVQPIGLIEAEIEQKQALMEKRAAELNRVVSREKQQYKELAYAL